MKLPRLASLTLVALAVGFVVLSGCSPVPEPTPTPTAVFASEEEAFAAAEETYRAYNDAGNARRNGSTSSDPQSFLIGAALENDVDGQNLLQEKGLSSMGDVVIQSFVGVSAGLTADEREVRALVCLDASAIRVLDESGSDVTPAEREQLLGQEVTFVVVGDTILIAGEVARESASC